MRLVLPVRISGRERKQKAKKLLYDCRHFENLLIMLIRLCYERYGKSLVNISILRGLFSKEYKGKYQEEFQELLNLIAQDEELKEVYSKLKGQWGKISNSDILVSVIRKVVKDFFNYFKALASYRVNSEKFNGIPRSPKPKKLKYVNSYSVEFVTSMGVVKQGDRNVLIQLRKGIQRKFLKVKFPEWFNYKITSARLKVIGDDIWVDLVYEYPVEKIEPKGRYRAGIDLGLDELISVVSENPEIRSWIISGRELKSFNQWYNKKRGELQSRVAKGDESAIYELRRLSAYRRRYLNTLKHQVMKRLAIMLYETGHKMIYVGKNCINKNGISLSRKMNEQFVSIPHREFLECFKYHAERLGMQVIEVDESYTSKTSPFADVLRSQETRDFKGKRERNLFKDFTTGKIFHADLVGALNILRKGAKLLKLEWYSNLKLVFKKLCNPKRVRLWDWIYGRVFPESLFITGIGGSYAGVISAGGTSVKSLELALGER